jgi:hypothetical protein
VLPPHTREDGCDVVLGSYHLVLPDAPKPVYGLLGSISESCGAPVASRGPKAPLEKAPIHRSISLRQRPTLAGAAPHTAQ